MKRGQNKSPLYSYKFSNSALVLIMSNLKIQKKTSANFTSGYSIFKINIKYIFNFLIHRSILHTNHYSKSEKKIPFCEKVYFCFHQYFKS